MQPLDSIGESAVSGQLIGRDAQTRPRHAGVVEIRLDGRILGIDAQSARKAVDQRPLSETCVLRKGVEGYVAAAVQDLVDVVIRIGGGIGVGRTAELLQHKPCFGGRTGRGSVGVGRQLGEDAPHGAGLQGDDDLGTRFAAHAVDHLQIMVQQRLIEHVARRRQFQKVNHRAVFKSISTSFPRCLRSRPAGSGPDERKRSKQMQK